MIKKAGKAGLLLLVEIGLALIFLVVIIVGAFLLQRAKNTIQFSCDNIEHVFKDNEDSFDIVAAFIQEEALSQYHQDGSPDISYITISKPESLPEDSIYMYHVTTDVVDTMEIPNTKTNKALDDLFQNTDLFYIRQTKSAESRNIYFLFAALAGIVYSSSGDKPSDGFDNSMDYSYVRINSNWFYWKGAWPD